MKIIMACLLVLSTLFPITAQALYCVHDQYLNYYRYGIQGTTTPNFYMVFGTSAEGDVAGTAPGTPFVGSGLIRASDGYFVATFYLYTAWQYWWMAPPGYGSGTGGWVDNAGNTGTLTLTPCGQ